MKAIAEILYQSLQEDLLLYKEKGLAEVTQTECCYQVIIKYWRLLRKRLVAYAFSSVAEEIYFYKHIKPLFTSPIIYNELVYHIRLFVPHDPVVRKGLLEREHGRLQRFIVSNENFYKDYKSADRNGDEALFLTANYVGGSPLPSYEYDEKYITRGDALVAQLKALENYHQFVSEQLQFIEKEAR